MKKAVRDLVLGMKDLPEKGGYWGLLLSKKGVPADLEPASASAIQSVNDRYILFAPSLQASNRGFGFVFGSVIGLAFLSMFVSVLTIYGLYNDAGFVVDRLIVLLILAILGAGFFGWAYVSLRTKVSPPVVLSKRLRRFYYWMNSKDGWISLPYDDVQPVNMVARMYSTAGGSTAYVLAMVDLVPGSRRIRWYLPLAVPHRSIETPERIWAFIRCYMDGAPEYLPPVEAQPAIDDPRADLARMDRFLFGSLVDENHRVVPGVFSKLYVGFVGAPCTGSSAPVYGYPGRRLGLSGPKRLRKKWRCRLIPAPTRFVHQHPHNAWPTRTRCRTCDGVGWCSVASPRYLS